MPTPYLQAEHLSKSFGDKQLFSELSLSIAEGQKVALIARNGIGKSSLLNILTGTDTPDSGTIVTRRELKIGYLQQHPLLSPDKTVWETCNHHDNEVLVKQILTQFRITDYTQRIGTLSGGQQKRVALANVLIAKPDLLILDEPTNHLDLDMVEWLEKYLRQPGITLLMVTHDRYFLDNVCSDILEIDQGEIYAYHGNYACYLQKRAERMEQQQAETEKARNLYRTELEWMRRMPQARAHKAQYRIDNFYNIEQRAQRRTDDSHVQLQVKASYIGSKIFEAKAVCKAFGDNRIVDNFNYVFARYEKLGIIGNNGAGKSTFLKLLLGEMKPDSGTFDIGQTVRFGYYSQAGLQLDPSKKVIDIVRDIAETISLGDGRQLTASQFLQHFLFSPQQQYDYADKLSGGEKQRLHLCTVLMSNPNFLILDEPTNDLDLPTLQILEDYLQHFHGCLIVVSHDRYFMDKVVDHLFVFHGNAHIQDYPGNYTQYRAAKEEEEKKVRKDTAPTEQTGPRTNERKRKLTFKEQQELRQIEQDLPRLEEEKQALEAQLSGSISDATAIATASARYEEVSALLNAAELRWLQLTDLC